MGARRRAMREHVRYGCMPSAQVAFVGRDAICKAQRAWHEPEAAARPQTKLRIWQILVASLKRSRG